MSTTFLEVLTSEFGTDHLYSCDMFNENGFPHGIDPVSYLDSLGKGVYGSLAAVDPSAVWSVLVDFFPISLYDYPPSNHLLLDSAFNLGPLISRWEINKFEIC
jgi:hypothetical protein